MDKSNILRMVVIEDSPNEVEMLSNVLRRAGYGVRPVPVEDEEDLVSALKGHSPDLILCKSGQKELSIEQAVQTVAGSGQSVPLIAVCDRLDEAAITAALRAGARDLVSRQQAEHLQLVVARELESLEARRALKHCEKVYRESEKRCRSLLDSSRDAIAYVHEGMHIYCNAVYLAMFGFHDLEAIEGTPFMNMVAPEDHGKLKEFLRSYSKSGGARAELELQALGADGEIFKALVEFTPASIEGEKCTQIVVRDRPVDQRELESRIKLLSDQDLLTGLYNRQYFLQALNAMVSDAADGTGKAALLYIAIDDFKAIKKTVGIALSDLILTGLAGLLQKETGEGDTAARFSDYAFTILARNCAQESAQTLAERIRRAVEDHVFNVADQSITATCSIGIAFLGSGTKHAQEALSRAELACEAARSSGNKVQLHNLAPAKPQQEKDEGASQWEKKIRDALEKDRFRLVYQPIMALRGEPGENYEVLVRMLDDQGADILPNQFLPTAEWAGLIVDIDRWVIRHAVSALIEQRRTGRDLRFFVKLSGQSLADSSLLPWIHEHLSNARLSERNIIFEVAESVAASHLTDAKAFLQGLKNLHCKAALNRFGNSPNSFALLKHLPVDFLKIDGSLIDDLARSPDNQAAVKAITEKAGMLGKQTVAEFVESAASLTVLWNCGVDYIQGNFLQAPDGSLNFDFSVENI